MNAEEVARILEPYRLNGATVGLADVAIAQAETIERLEATIGLAAEAFDGQDEDIEALKAKVKALEGRPVRVIAYDGPEP